MPTDEHRELADGWLAKWYIDPGYQTTTSGGTTIGSALATLIAEREAAARARAVEEAAHECKVRRQMYEGDLARALSGDYRDVARIRIGVATVLEDEIRTLVDTPDPELVVARREDLDLLHANAAINNECNVESTESHLLLSEWGVPEAPESVPGAKRLQWRLRAALARMGESDG